MKALLVLRRRRVVDELALEEAVIWRVPTPVAGSEHPFKYRLAFVVNGVCVVRYDNERGKGDHRHVGDQEWPYVFTDIRRLLADFRRDVAQWRDRHGDSNI